MSTLDTSIANLSLEEKASLTGGADFWTTKAVGQVPSLMLTDGPHGLRKQDVEAGGDHVGIGASVAATCFPPAVGLGQSWNPELIRRVGVALGEECVAENVGVLLGPGINIKRDPRCGRNFEYVSEDPLLSGAFGAAWVNGVQSQGVGTSLKHFAANNTEHDRMRSSSDVDPRTLREIYLRAFQTVVEDAAPWTVMCSYNRINGVYVSENEWLLTSVLRNEWGFDGVVVSDWGAVRNRAESVAAGLDLEMPGGNAASDAQLATAVRAGALDEAVVDRAARRVAALAAKADAGRRGDAEYDQPAHHALAREAAGQSIVLLKNDGALLPLSAEGSIAVVGEFAQVPRFQGGGSSNVNAPRVDIPLDEIRSRAAEASVSFAAGFRTDGTGDPVALRDEAVRVAADADVAVLFLGLAPRQESEGFDRDHIELPDDQLALAEAVLAVQPKTIVALSHGGVLRLTPLSAVPAILDGALLGQAGGSAIADVLFGDVNPSGRLTETVPVRLQDTPAYLNFPGENSRVTYGEGLHVGYRWYDAREIDVSFPFGHGLSYTRFEYSDLAIESDESGITARVAVTNVGDRAGREVVQIYTALPGSAVVRAPRELKGFGSVVLEPGERRELTVSIGRRELAYWETRLDSWVVESGKYEIFVGASSRDLRLSGSVEVSGDSIRVPLTGDSTIAEVLATPAGAATFGAVMENALGKPDESGDGDLGVDMAVLLGSFPVGRFVTSMGGTITSEQLEQLLAEVNAGS